MGARILKSQEISDNKYKYKNRKAITTTNAYNILSTEYKRSDRSKWQ